MNDIRKFIYSLIAMRLQLIKSGKSQRNEMQMYNNIKHLKTWLDMCPNATENQLLLFIRREELPIRSLIVGEQSKSFEQINNQLNEYLLHGSTRQPEPGPIPG
jgi:hypothetical protein